MSHDPPRARRRVVAAPTRKAPAELSSVRIVVVPDEHPDVSYLEQDELEERHAAYEQGEFLLVGVRAEAEVFIGGIAQTLKSGGLYGIESDSEEEYFDEIFAQEWATLRDVLKTVGVSTSQLPVEFDRAWVEWRM